MTLGNDKDLFIQLASLLFIKYMNTFDYFFFYFDLAWFSFQDRVSLCSPGCPGPHVVDQAGLKLRDLHVSASAKCWD